MESKADLTNGVTILHDDKECEGKVVFQYADGCAVRTTWKQLAQIENLAADLQQAYELLLARVDCPHACTYVPVELLARIDETLYRARTVVKKAGSSFNTHQGRRDWAVPCTFRSLAQPVT